MTALTALAEVPGPRGLPLIGNARDVDAEHPVESAMRLAKEYGPIFKLSSPKGDQFVVSGAELVDDLVDDSRFDKLIAGGLAELKSNGEGSAGLFSAETQDPLWRRAHNILMAPFSLQAMRDYTPMMVDIANQLMEKWARLNAGEPVDVPADMTRLTLDTIALCGFSYRFNSFYRDTPHPFVQAMVRTLDESQTRSRQLPVQTRLRVRAQRRVEEDQAFMNDLVDKIIEDRRAMGDEAPTDDLLGRMLTGIDKESGEGLPDINIRAQCLTFLIAGHETTSGLLSFALYYLMKNPQYMERARAEADQVLGTAGEPTFDQVQRLRFVRQVLQETLRLWPTAPGFTRYPYRDEVLAGRWAIPAGTRLTVLTPALHRDPSVWGPDAEEFNPDHTAPEKLAEIAPHLFLPFGTGQRACIGRQFALQEATLVLGMLLQRFEFVDHLDYQLRIKTTLTVKPEDFVIQVRPRTGLLIDHAAPPAESSLGIPAPRSEAVPSVAGHGTPLSVLFGSNLGTAEAIATRLAQEGRQRGFEVTLGALDEHVHDLPDRGAVLIVCSSYNGLPPDNAAQFCRWISSAPGDTARGVSYSVFGCGNREWAATYQAVPGLIDEALAAAGARRVHNRGEGDAAGDFDAAYRAWHGQLWADLASALGLPAEVAATAPAGPRLSITLTNRQVTNPVIVSYRAQPARVRANRELLHAAAGRSTGTSRSGCRRGRPTGPVTTSACCPATASTSSAGSSSGSGWTPGSTSPSSPPPAAWTPTCPSTSRHRCWGCWPAASSCRTSPAATTSRSWCATPTTPRRRRRCRRWPGTTRSPRPDTGTRSSRRTDPSWTSWSSTRRAGCRSRSTSTCCRRCARATTPSPPRRCSAPRSAVSPPGCCRDRPGPVGAPSPASRRATWRTCR
jgi:cytochrome P450/NADPH-cytochrome P450 reductase